MYTLFYSPGSCSMAIHTVLNELGQNVKLEKVALSEGQNRTPEFLRLNPRGQVPVLADGDRIIREGAAILIYLCEKHNSPLLPAKGDARTTALEWLMFCNATLHPTYSRAFFLMKNSSDENEKQKLLGVISQQINKLWAEVEARLENNQYLCGNEITVADILLTVIANWSNRIPNVVIGQNSKKLFVEVSCRPSFKKALELEQVEYKAAD